MLQVDKIEVLKPIFFIVWGIICYMLLEYSLRTTLVSLLYAELTVVLIILSTLI